VSPATLDRGGGGILALDCGCGDGILALDRGGGGGFLSSEVEKEQRWRRVDDGGLMAWLGGGCSSERRARGPSSKQGAPMALPSGGPCGCSVWTTVGSGELADGSGGGSGWRRWVGHG
jgi:hypothetical protein